PPLPIFLGLQRKFEVFLGEDDPHLARRRCETLMVENAHARIVAKGKSGTTPLRRRLAAWPGAARIGVSWHSHHDTGYGPMLDIEKAIEFVGGCWDEAIVPALVDYIRIPNKSPAFDPDWAAHGHMDEAVALFEGWARARLEALPGATLDTLRLPGRTPLIVIEVPGAGTGDTVGLYRPPDKQPQVTR